MDNSFCLSRNSSIYGRECVFPLLPFWVNNVLYNIFFLFLCTFFFNKFHYNDLRNLNRVEILVIRKGLRACLCSAVE